MTPIGIQRIEKRLELIVPHLDMADYATRPQQVRAASLSRALAAYCVKMLGETDDVTAAKSVTDTFHDRGIDAIYYDQKSSQLLLVQAKWSGGIAWKDAGEFVDGVKRLIVPDWDAFAKNEKIFNRRNEIDTALRSAAKVVLVTVHNGPAAADASVLGRVSERAAEIDGGSGIAVAVHWHQAHLLDSLRLESDPPKVDADLYLSHWGEIKDPYHAVFGRIQGQAVADLWKKNPHLTYMNLRDYAQRSDVNAAIAATVRDEPHHFWYFNNGLTIICESITPAVMGRLHPEVALFKLEGISLVNGAQTTGIVADHLASITEEERGRLWLQLRAIAVKNCPDGFAKRVTRYTNLQNAISVQDFVSLDPLQARIATDFAIAKRRYAFRWGGDSEPTGEQGCTLREATVALACAHPDLWFAVQAKREISVLWETESPRYKQLFHENLTATRIWNAVKILRKAGWMIDFHGHDDAPRADMVASHLQRIVLHVVFRDPALAGWDTASDSNAILGTVETLTSKVFEKVRTTVVAHNANEYLASLSKNVDKCRELVTRITAPPKDPSQPGPGQLF